jgi:hypothetical protein
VAAADDELVIRLPASRERALSIFSGVHHPLEEFVMNRKLNLKSFASLGALALAASSAFAADPAATANGPRERAEVIAETRAARSAGALAPAGEHVVPAVAVVPDAVARTRSEVQAEVRSARASGELIAAGEAEEFPALQAARGPVLARAEVKSEVLAARRAGELIPAGEGPLAEGFARAGGRNGGAVERTRTASLGK